MVQRIILYETDGSREVGKIFIYFVLFNYNQRSQHYSLDTLKRKHYEQKTKWDCVLNGGKLNGVKMGRHVCGVDWVEDGETTGYTSLQLMKATN